MSLRTGGGPGWRWLRGQHRLARPSFGGSSVLPGYARPTHQPHTATHTRYRFDGYEGMIVSVRACVYLTLWLGVREGRLVGGLGAWDRKLGSARLVPGWTDDETCS